MFAANVGRRVAGHPYHRIVNRPRRNRANQIRLGGQSEIIRMQHIDECAYIVAIEPLHYWLGDAPVRGYKCRCFALPAETVGDVDGDHEHQMLRAIVVLEIDTVAPERVFRRCSGEEKRPRNIEMHYRRVGSLRPNLHRAHRDLNVRLGRDD